MCACLGRIVAQKRLDELGEYDRALPVLLVGGVDGSYNLRFDLDLDAGLVVTGELDVRPSDNGTEDESCPVSDIGDVDDKDGVLAG